ncbi:MAG: hypothetical protein KF791_19180 [Verrucomicrobiae bacterium]|nr:hypothetical protein [Verrucomicrobiae bacterium]
MSSLPEEVSWQTRFVLSGDGSFMALAGAQWSVRPDGNSVSVPLLVTSDNHGMTWNRCELPPEIVPEWVPGNPWDPVITDIALSQDGRQIFLAVAGVACLSQDHGQTWKVVVLWDEGWISHVAVSADGDTLVVGAEGTDDGGNPVVRLLLSTDSASTWSRLTGHGVGASRSLNLVASGDRGLRIVVALEDSLLVSEDQGQSWQSQDLNHVPSAFAFGPGGIQVLSAPAFNRPWPGIWTPSPISFSADSGATWQDADLGWVELVAMSQNGSVQVAAPDYGVIHINGVVYPPTILDTRREGDLGLDGDRSVTLGVEATGGRLIYQWRRDGTPLADGPSRSGTKSSELKLNSASQADLGTYSVVVSNAEGSVEQEVFTLKLDAPTLSDMVQTGSTALVDGAPVSFGVTASGGLLSFQWRKNGVDLTDAPGRAGSRSRELKLDSTSVADLGTYSVVVSNASGLVTADVGELKLTLPRLVAAQPPSGSAVVPGASTHLQIQVEGGEIEVEWLLNGVPLNRSGTWSGPGVHWIELTNIQTADVGEYSARLRNPSGEVVVKVAQVSQASWQRADLPAAAWNSVAMSASGDRILVSSPDRVMASLEGRTWAPLSAPGTDWTCVGLGAESATVILGQGTSLLDSLQPTSGSLSADFGETWRSWIDPGDLVGKGIWRTKAVACSADSQTLLISQDNTTYIGRPPFPVLPMPESRLRISHDGGQTWNTANADEQADLWRSVSISSDARVMAAVRQRFYAPAPWQFLIHVSTNFGVHWQSVILPEAAVRAVAVSGDGRRVVALVGDGLYACDPTVLDWRRINAPPANWVALALSHDGRRIFAADYGSPTSGGTVHQSNDGGQTWRWSGSPSANWTAIACSADGERVVGASSQGLFLAPGMATSVVAAVPLPATSNTSGLRFAWQGTPHRTYHLLSTHGLDGQAWQSAGAAVADPEGRVSIIDRADASQRFWQAVEVP